MKYTAKYFKDNMPEWKRKKDPPLSRIFYRKTSFYCAAFAANKGITANGVSYFSMYVAIVACALFLLCSKPFAIAGAVLINIWLILDCTDGNLARNVKSQPFGEFADGISSYVLVGLMCTTMGFYVYHHGGMIFCQGNAWIILLGALASNSDTMMRLIYQKYKGTERDMADKGIMQMSHDDRTDHAKVSSLRVRIEADLGIGGILPLVILLGVLFDFLDLVVIYTFLYYGGSCILTGSLTIKRARKVEKL